MLMRAGAAGWLHFMTDSKPGDKPASYPIYSVEPHGRPNPTGSFKRYQPKVHTTGKTNIHQSNQLSSLAVMSAQRSGPVLMPLVAGELHSQQAAPALLLLHMLHHAGMDLVTCWLQGAWGNTQRRHWQKFTAWSPTAQTGVRGAVPDSA